MTLQLTTAQALELSAALANYLQELEFEIARTDEKAFRHDLRTRADLLEEIRRRLDAARSAEESAYA